jgi:hypothetical protein
VTKNSLLVALLLRAITAPVNSRPRNGELRYVAAAPLSKYSTIQHSAVPSCNTSQLSVSVLPGSHLYEGTRLYSVAESQLYSA